MVIFNTSSCVTPLLTAVHRHHIIMNNKMSYQLPDQLKSWSAWKLARSKDIEKVALCPLMPLHHQSRMQTVIAVPARDPAYIELEGGREMIQYIDIWNIKYAYQKLILKICMPWDSLQRLSQAETYRFLTPMLCQTNRSSLTYFILYIWMSQVTRTAKWSSI